MGASGLHLMTVMRSYKIDTNSPMGASGYVSKVSEEDEVLVGRNVAQWVTKKEQKMVPSAAFSASSAPRVGFRVEVP